MHTFSSDSTAAARLERQSASSMLIRTKSYFCLPWLPHVLRTSSLYPHPSCIVKHLVDQSDTGHLKAPASI